MFELEVTQRITKELLLSKYSQETYFEHYLGIPVKNGLFCSPPIIRKDRTPTCAFYKNRSGVLKYKDFAGPTFDFVGCVMYIFNVTYYYALKIIANDFGFIEAPNLKKNEKKIEEYTGMVIKETKTAKIQVQIKDFSEKELNWWKNFGISIKTLNKFKVFSVKAIFLNGVYHSSSSESSPIYGYYGGINSNKDELWRLYMPTKIKYRFLSNWNSTLIQGSKQLPKNGDYIVITKSLKDVMSLYEFGVTAIAPNSENLFLTDAQYKKLKEKFKEVYILYDNDLPGIRAANKIRKSFDVKVLLMPKGTKDFTDYVKKYGTLKALNLVEEWQKSRKQKLLHE